PFFVHGFDATTGAAGGKARGRGARVVSRPSTSPRVRSRGPALVDSHHQRRTPPLTPPLTTMRTDSQQRRRAPGSGGGGARLVRLLSVRVLGGVLHHDGGHASRRGAA